MRRKQMKKRYEKMTLEEAVKIMEPYVPDSDYGYEKERKKEKERVTQDGE